MRRILLLFMLSLTFVLAGAHTHDIYFNNIYSGDIQVGMVVYNGIIQDKNGIIWVGTRQGLYSYNGLEFQRHFPLEEEIGSERNRNVSMLCEGDGNNIYMLTNKRFTIYNCDTESFSVIGKNDYNVMTSGSNGIWSAFANKIYRFTDNIILFHMTLPLGTNITALCEHSDQTLYVGTSEGTVYSIDKNKKSTVLFDCGSEISNIKIDSRKNIWVCSWNDGLFRIDHNGSITNYRHNPKDPRSISSDNVRTVCEDEFGDMWIGTINGVSRFYINSNYFVHYGQAGAKYPGPINNSIWTLYRDRQGTIYGGSYFGGIFSINPKYDIYNHHYIVRSDSGQQPIFSQMIKDKYGIIWIATEGNGIVRYDEKSDTFIYFTHDPLNRNTISHNHIKKLYYDEQTDLIWIGTHLSGTCIINVKNNNVRRIEDLSDPSFLTLTVRDIASLDGSFILGTDRGIHVYDPVRSRSCQFSDMITNEVTSLIIDKKRKLWAGSDKGLYSIDLTATRSADSSSIRLYTMADGMSSNKIHSLYEDKYGDIWIGYEDSGLDKYEQDTRKFIEYSKQSCGLHANSITTIKESASGYMLIATENGFSRLDPENMRSYNYSSSNGFPIRSMSPGGILMEDDGTILLSGTNGLISVKEDRLMSEPKKFSISFCDLAVNNKPIKPNDHTGILQQSLPGIKILRLKHFQNAIRLSVNSDNYIKANQIEYWYRLKGLQEDWVECPDNRAVIYTNLTPGSYQLQVKGIDINHADNKSFANLDITVLPPFHKTWWAYCLYAILALAITWQMIRVAQSKLRLKTSLLLERQEKEQSDIYNRSKLNFFTNISHEFRTPITLILGQLQLLEESSMPYSSKAKVAGIYKNAYKMQEMISELLDFTKNEQGFMRLKVAQYDIVEFCREIFDSFCEYATFRETTFSLESNDDKIMLWFDAKQMQKVCYNLISNAFKYTPKNGEIKISIEQTAGYVNIKISDTGIGFSQEELRKIFDCYYQAENISGNNSISPGSGIGLALVKGIVDSHHGKINVTTLENLGSIFTVTLKTGRDHLENDPMISLRTAVDLDKACIEKLRVNTDRSSEVISHADSLSKSKILIVEDNSELRDMLCQIFESFGKTITAQDGLEGFKTAKKEQPDLIITDVMMPVMSGFELCMKIKNDFSTSHIPVIILTAYANLEQNIKGLRNGADDYIAKPFDTRLLITRCNNILRNRNMLREKYRNEISSGSSDMIITSSGKDQLFIKKAVSVVEENIENESFNSKIFAGQMNMSQTSLYNKLKAITGQSISQFIQTIRLRKAAAIIKAEPTSHISEIAYRMGFCNPKYFSKCFNAQFGIPPNEYRKSAHTSQKDDPADSD